jgi:hypothetical protein
MVTLEKSPFKSAHSIVETLDFAHLGMLLHLHDYIGFRSFHLHWCCIY